MNLKERLKFLQNKKFVKSMTIGITLYSLIISVLVSYTSFTFFETVESISLPSGYFTANLNSSSPFVEISFSISNTGIFECNDLRLELNFEVEYFKNDESNSTISEIMYHMEEFDKIQGLQRFDYLITSTESDFNITNLIAFEMSCNLLLAKKLRD